VAKRFGSAVKHLRLKKGMTQQKLADDCGLDIGYIGGIERGQRNPSLEVIISVAEVLEVTVSQLAKHARI
jgi:transcriptional regulator with XRE-family HTH domain